MTQNPDLTPERQPEDQEAGRGNVPSLRKSRGEA